jgi:hypothetical protein
LTCTPSSRHRSIMHFLHSEQSLHAVSGHCVVSILRHGTPPPAQSIARPLPNEAVKAFAATCEDWLSR